MSARAPASPCARLALIALIVTVQYIDADQITCSKDGLYADYESDCREYVRCVGSVVRGRYACAEGRAFSEAAGACVPRGVQPCVRRRCAPGDTLAYSTPGTACRQYYRCENGTAVDHACPSGAWFDLDRQACARGAGTCYEPLCVGLPDGVFPDASHDCRRTLNCRGAELRSVRSCVGPCSSQCPPPRSSSIPLPAGDADFCSDDACSSLCQHAENGAYADRSTGCREYFVCEARRVTRRGVCDPGLTFSEGGCVLPSQRVSCPPPARSPCFKRADGLYRDWRDCSSWFDCRRERVIARGSCDSGLVFDGTACVPTDAFACEGPVPSAECEGLPSGMYQDLGSNCTRYFHCEGSLRTTLTCPAGQVYDGAKCLPTSRYLCPSLERDSCYGRGDGRYRSPDTGCRGYYACTGGEKAVYACAVGRVFDGESCVTARKGVCTSDDYSCAGLPDGYHPETETDCRRYFFCERGDRLATLSCQGGKIFDGHACVDPSRHKCGSPLNVSLDSGAKNCERDGFFLLPGTECKSYFFCVTGTRTYLTCPVDQIFNGQVCVPRSQYNCPG